MKIVINLLEEDYKRIQDIPDAFNSLTSRVYSAIRNGTPIPKEHGESKDATNLMLRSTYDRIENLLDELSAYDLYSPYQEILNELSNMVEELYKYICKENDIYED